MSTEPALLRIAELSFSYPARHVFTRFSRGFPGGLTWLRGGNGSGKSTLLKLAGGALPPMLGRLEVDGIDAVRQPLDYRRRVFWCGPGPVALDHLTPAEYCGFLAGLYPSFDRRQLTSHIEGFALGPHLGRTLRTLSTGTQRKVWIAAALAAGTRVTLMDEPLNALDAASAAHLRGALSACAAQSERAWIVTSHEDIGPAAAHARVLDLDAPDDLNPGRASPS
jgi:ABC-type multidrug transport system ATPase subunit